MKLDQKIKGINQMKDPNTGTDGSQVSPPDDRNEPSVQCEDLLSDLYFPWRCCWDMRGLQVSRRF